MSEDNNIKVKNKRENYLTDPDNRKKLKEKIKKLIKDGVDKSLRDKDPSSKIQFNTDELREDKDDDIHEHNFNILTSEAKKAADEINLEVYRELKEELSEEEWNKLKEKASGRTKFKLKNVRERSKTEGEHNTKGQIGAKIELKEGSREEEVEEFWANPTQSEMAKIGANVKEGIAEYDELKKGYSNKMSRGLSKEAKEKLKRSDILDDEGFNIENIDRDENRKLLYKLNLDVFSKKEGSDPSLSNNPSKDLYSTMEENFVRPEFSDKELEDIGEYYILDAIGEENLTKEEKKRVEKIEKNLNLKEKVGTENLELQKQLSERAGEEVNMRADIDTGGANTGYDSATGDNSYTAGGGGAGGGEEKGTEKEEKKEYSKKEKKEVKEVEKVLKNEVKRKKQEYRELVKKSRKHLSKGEEKKAKKELAKTYRTLEDLVRIEKMARKAKRKRRKILGRGKKYKEQQQKKKRELKEKKKREAKKRDRRAYKLMKESLKSRKKSNEKLKKDSKKSEKRKKRKRKK